MRNSTVEQQLIECGWKNRQGSDYLKIAVKNSRKLNLHLVSLFFLRIAATHVVGKNGNFESCLFHQGVDMLGR